MESVMVWPKGIPLFGIHCLIFIHFKWNVLFCISGQSEIRFRLESSDLRPHTSVGPKFPNIGQNSNKECSGILRQKSCLRKQRKFRLPFHAQWKVGPRRKDRKRFWSKRSNLRNSEKSFVQCWSLDVTISRGSGKEQSSVSVSLTFNLYNLLLEFGIRRSEMSWILGLNNLYHGFAKLTSIIFVD